jgi:hypothetical protein
MPCAVPNSDKLAVRLGECPSCAGLMCTRCKNVVKPEDAKKHMCTQATATIDPATLYA